MAVLSILRIAVCFVSWLHNIWSVTIKQLMVSHICLRRGWRYERGNQNPYIEEEQTTHWPKEKVRKGKQRSIKHTYKTKD